MKKSLATSLMIMLPIFGSCRKDNSQEPAPTAPIVEPKKETKDVQLVVVEKPEYPFIYALNANERFATFRSAVRDKRKRATLFLVVTGVETILTQPVYAQFAKDLSTKLDLFTVILELPCHGAQTTVDDPPELTCLRTRLLAGRSVATEFSDYAKKVYDFLKKRDLIDETRVAAAAFGRGGFFALNWAAQDSNMNNLMLFTPLVDFRTLNEMSDIPYVGDPKEIDARNIVGDLKEKRIFWAIGNKDERSSTAISMNFVKDFVAKHSMKTRSIDEPASNLELMIYPGIAENPDYTPQPGAIDWVLRQWKVK